MTEQVQYEWKRATEPDENGLWWVNDWQHRWHHFSSEADQLAFIDRDKRMLAGASREAMADATAQITEAFENQSGVKSDGEQAVDRSSQGETPGAPVGCQGNRKTRRRAGSAANREKASGRRGQAT